MKSQAILLALAVVAGAGTASAQTASGATSASTANAAPGSVEAGKPIAAEAWLVPPVGKYQITLTFPSHDMTADVTVREESGKLIANIWPVGDNDGRDFGATVSGNQLVISGTTERGALNLTLEHRGPKITGTWKLGEQGGTLTGEFVK
ncbi:MAG TPA: hypothetical protein VFP26_10160 [Gemmatimonadaceae bacterium]|jgi:hypothetical protein|nr:hypothetical protein [Gemmatimonadaceae bacterium]